LSLKLDEANREIIHSLRENARTTFVDIGKALGIFDATVYNRVKRLMEMGAITRFATEVDKTAIDKKTHGFILVNVKPCAVKEISRRLCEIERVSEVHDIHGSEGLIVKARGKNLGRLSSVLLRATRVPDMVQTEFIPIFKTWKG